MADRDSEGRFTQGNQIAKGHGFGAPKIYTIEIIEQYAKEFYEWSKHPSSMILGQFYDIHDLYPQRMQDFAEQSSVFAEALKIGKARIAERRERLVHYGKLEKSTFNRYQGFFDQDLRDHERTEKEFEYRVKANLEQKNNAQIIIQPINYADANDGN